MEWNWRTPVEWNGGSLSPYSAKATEISERLWQSSPETQVDGGIHSNAVRTPKGDDFSGSDLAHGSLSQHSVSASDDLSSWEEAKTFSAIAWPKEFGDKNQLVRVDDCRTRGDSFGSVEPPIGLKLGKRTYFEDFCTLSTTNASCLPAVPTSSANTAKRVRKVYQSVESARCQVEGCDIDLKSAKDYHRKHRICVSHSKSPKVTVDGTVRRFCQQCSRLHDLSEFDDKKRSCRRRLSDHNARRRRPRPEALHINLSRLPSSFYDGRQQQMNLVSDGVSVPIANSTWQSSGSLKAAFSQTSLIRPAKAGCIGRHLDMPTEEMSNSSSMLHLDTSRILPAEDSTSQMLGHDLRRALSLLSADPWGLNEPESPSMDQFMHLNQSSMVHPVLHGESQNWDSSSGYACAEQLPSESRHSWVLNNSSISPFQELQFFKTPYDSGFFYSNQIN